MASRYTVFQYGLFKMSEKPKGEESEKWVAKKQAIKRARNFVK
jgi:hypothetical protein